MSEKDVLAILSEESLKYESCLYKIESYGSFIDESGEKMRWNIILFE